MSHSIKSSPQFSPGVQRRCPGKAHRTESEGVNEDDELLRSILVKPHHNIAKVFPGEAGLKIALGVWSRHKVCRVAKGNAFHITELLLQGRFELVGC